MKPIAALFVAAVLLLSAPPAPADSAADAAYRMYVANPTAGARDKVRHELSRLERNIKRGQNDVRKLDGEIASQKRWIATLQRRITSKKRWFERKKWYEKTWAGPEFTAYAAARNAEIATAYTKIGGLEAAKHAALGVLTATRKSAGALRRALRN